MSYSNPTRHRVTPGHTPTSEARVAGATHRIDFWKETGSNPGPDDASGLRWAETMTQLRDRFDDEADGEVCLRAYLAAFLRESIR